MLTLVDAFSGWIEAFPMRSEIASEVTQFLIGEIIPRFGLPLSLQSDNGQWASFYHPNHWTGNPSLGITWKLHIPYRPQSSGKVEKANSVLKTHLTKLSLELQRPWTELLSMALACIRATPGAPSFLSPFEHFLGGSDGKTSAYNAGDPGSIPGLGRSPGEGNGNPLQQSCLKNPADGGA